MPLGKNVSEGKVPELMTEAQSGSELKNNKGLVFKLYATILIFFPIYYILCRSNNFFEVDGPHRVFDVYNAKEPFLHPNSHLLFPINFLIWNDLLTLVIGPAGDLIEYCRRSQCLNSVCMGIAVANLFLCSTKITTSIWVPLFISFCFGSASAVMLHGTNCSEPVIGFTASTVAISLLLKKKSPGIIDLVLCMFAGIMLALAMANYQTMVFVGPGCLALALFGWRENKVSIFPNRAILFLMGCVFGTILFFLVPYWLDGTGGLGACIARFFQNPGEGHVWGGVSIRKVINAYPGFLSNQFLFPEWSGIREFIRRKPDYGTIIWVAITVAASVPVIGVVLRKSFRLAKGKTPEAIQIFGMMVTPLLFLCYWDPTYNKMWLQPLWIFWLIASSGIMKSGKIIRLTIVSIFLPMIFLNMIWLPLRCQGEIKYLADANKLLSQIKHGDQIVAEWNEVVMFAAGIDPAREIEFMANRAITDPGSVQPRLKEMERSANKNGTKMFFLGILDVDQDQWEEFLGNKVGLPFTVLDEYRARATKVGQIGGKHQVSIFRIDDQKGD